MTTTDSASSRPVFDAMTRRASHSKVTDEAPSHEELGELISVMSSVPDHSRLRPWRIIELRGKDREALGKALAKANKTPKEKGISKATRAPLLLAPVVCPKKSKKVPYWEQEAVAAGVAHLLSLLLAEAGWGTMWRTGLATRSKAVRKAMKLAKDEQLLGWIYVGGVPENKRKPKPRKPLDLKQHLTSL
ncbi:nitroreductase family protein [Enteractinococcus coprophilus]|uniref:Putative NAD(P)H nitroreductase n=1 Tax=Enteractinococcus coprophilus TaxID=1027633 RepID=A0A543AMP9_9MICC|nr:nitroreductase family protein [Enteractinococcus coprophilus]TQL73861.1 nitroreductase [Enteractinococcus coprophilus]